MLWSLGDARSLDVDTTDRRHPPSNRAIFEQAPSGPMRPGEQANESEVSGRRFSLAGENQAQLLAALLQSNGSGAERVRRASSPSSYFGTSPRIQVASRREPIAISTPSLRMVSLAQGQEGRSHLPRAQSRPSLDAERAARDEVRLIPRVADGRQFGGMGLRLTSARIRPVGAS